jgi:aspartyl/asparaginyl beta-hydroxylase (cupin superfamily)
MEYDFEELKERFKPIEDRWEDIKAEYENIADNFSSWPSTYINNGDTWTLFPVFDRRTESIGDRMGVDIEEVFQPLVPLTTKLIRENIPTHGACAFSRMEPGAVLKPHYGFKTAHLRYHLGIDCPVGNIGLFCENKIYRWTDGESFIFDDRKLHHAWNKSRKRRTILMIDFVP